MANAYDVGDLVRCTGTFTDASGTATDPDAVVFKIKDPSAVTTTYTYVTDAEVIKTATGVYYVDVNVDEAGTWWYRFEATGGGQSAAEDNFYARQSQF